MQRADQVLTDLEKIMKLVGHRQNSFLFFALHKIMIREALYLVSAARLKSKNLNEVSYS